MSETDHLIKKYDRFLFTDGNGLGANQDLWSICEPAISGLLDQFYATLMKEPELMAMLGEGVDVGALKKAQTNHWRMLIGGRLDDAYIESAVKIGSVHERVGLDLGWYIAAYAWVMMRLVPTVASKSMFQSARTKENLAQLVSRVFIDILVSSTAYQKKSLDVAIGFNERRNRSNNLRSLANTVVTVNATSFILARLIGNSKRARLSSETISSAASELVASVEQIAESSEAAANEAHESNETVLEGHTAISDAASAINKMLSAVDETNDGIQELSEASSQIGQILTVIEDIADQTNLLALNATIEAARAGEAGKGFAIVASEVKNLASQTSKSTEDIARRIEALTSGMEKIRQTMSNSQSAVGEGETAITSATQTMDRIQLQVSSVYEKMLDISNILQQQKGATNEIAESIASVAEISGANENLVMDMADGFKQSNDEFMKTAKLWFQESSDQALCEMAKIDHVLFKKRIVDTIMERDNWKSGEVPDHHLCRLGKWYDSLNRPTLVNHPAYKALVEPHRCVHLHGKQALDRYVEGDLEAAIAEVEKMNHASHDVIRLLDELSHALDDDLFAKDRKEIVRKQNADSAKSGSNVESIAKSNSGSRNAA